MKTNSILIDFENVQPKDLAALRGRLFKTKVFFGANQQSVPIGFATGLQPFGSGVQDIQTAGVAQLTPFPA